MTLSDQERDLEDRMRRRLGVNGHPESRSKATKPEPSTPLVEIRLTNDGLTTRWHFVAAGKVQRSFTSVFDARDEALRLKRAGARVANMEALRL